jgi:2'-5' RNA ligase
VRLFIAIRLGDSVVDAALKCAADLRQRLPASVKARWVSGDQMHLTVRFIGEVREESVPRLVAAVREPLPIEPFDVGLGACGAFPPKGAPRVLWLGLSSGQDSLRKIHHELDRRILTLGYSSEGRDFAAHLTLARVKDAPRSAVQPVHEALGGLKLYQASCRVTSATLFRSHVSPRGAHYSPLLEIPFAAA